MTLVGVLLGGQIADPSRLGLDVVFPAAMAGLCVGMVTGRREVVAALTGAGIGVAASLAAEPAVGIVAGGLIGPLIAMAIPGSRPPEALPPVDEGGWP
jgi:predicted branched-subunit amino acid permease